MQKIIFLFLLLPVFASAQIVNIPDNNFKTALITDSTININFDGEIQVFEAEIFTGSIDVYNKGISDLTGIEAFTSLTQLFCDNNSLTSLDVSNNTALTHLICAGNSLTSLDVSNNTALTELFCGSNLLTSMDVRNGNNTSLFFEAIGNPDLSCISVDDALWADINWSGSKDATASFSNDCGGTAPIVFIPDANFKAALVGNLTINTNGDGEIQVSEATAYTGSIDVSSLGISDLTGIEAFTALTSLWCAGNSLTSLDVSNNTALTEFLCANNFLTSLDVRNGNNTSMFFDATDNPTLTCISVDDVSWADINWLGNKDAIASFSNDCGSNSTSCLIAQYDFSGDATDNTGNGNNGIVHGATLTTDRHGNENSAYAFDGGSSWIEIPNSLMIDLSELAISVWFKPGVQKTTGQTSIFHQVGDAYEGETYLTYFHDDGELRFGLGDEGSNFTSVVTSNYPEPDKWHHAVLTYNGAHLTAYMDGGTISESALTFVWAYYCSGSFGVGNLSSVLSEGFVGSIDDIKIWECGLVAPQVDSIYQAEKSGTAPTCEFFNYHEPTCVDANDGQATVTVFGSNPNFSVMWSNGGSNTGLGNGGSYLETNLSVGTYTVTVTDNLGATSTCGVTLETTFPCEPIIVDEVVESNIWTAITPNGDGSNDYWMLWNPNITTPIKVMIFDRWGKVVWRSEDYKNEWNGVDQNNIPLEDGTYFYIVENNGNTISMHISIVR